MIASRSRASLNKRSKESKLGKGLPFHIYHQSLFQGSPKEQIMGTGGSSFYFAISVAARTFDFFDSYLNNLTS